MRIGDIWKVTIPPKLAYGSHGGAKIPPNSTHEFEIEMLEVVAR